MFRTYPIRGYELENGALLANKSGLKVFVLTVTSSPLLVPSSPLLVPSSPPIRYRHHNRYVLAQSEITWVGLRGLVAKEEVVGVECRKRWHGPSLTFCCVTASDSTLTAFGTGTRLFVGNAFRLISSACLISFRVMGPRNNDMAQRGCSKMLPTRVCTSRIRNHRGARFLMTLPSSALL